MTEATTQSEIHKIQQAAQDASNLVAQEAAAARQAVSQDATSARQAISAAAASALSTLTVASAVQQKDIDYIRKTLDGLSTKFDQLGTVYITKIELEPIREVQVDHEARIRVTEKFQTKIIGALILSDILLAAGIPIFLFILNK